MFSFTSRVSNATKSAQKTDFSTSIWHSCILKSDHSSKPHQLTIISRLLLVIAVFISTMIPCSSLIHNSITKSLRFTTAIPMNTFQRLSVIHPKYYKSNFQIRRLSMKSRPDYLDMEDVLLSGLNNRQDVSVKVVSCKEVIQEAMNRKRLTVTTARALGETIACSLLMGSGLKGEETLQVNLVGTKGIVNVMAITDGSLKVKGMVGDSAFDLTSMSKVSETRDAAKLGCYDLMGEGQVQVVRNHPSWKHAMNGIVSLKDTDIPMNLALYLLESEQRSAVLLTDVRIAEASDGVSGAKCEHAMALLVESLPGVEEGTLEKCISNVKEVQARGLSSYLSPSEPSPPFLLEGASDRAQVISKAFIPVGPVSLRMEEVLHRILDDCFKGMDETEGPSGSGLRFSKTPKFYCQCSEDRVLRALTLLPRQDIDEIVTEGKDVESTCGFCGKSYKIPVADLTARLANSKTVE